MAEAGHVTRWDTTARRLAALGRPLGPVQECTVVDWLSPSRERGLASWDGPGFHGRTTAGGAYDTGEGMTAAHRSPPFGTRVRVTNLANGRRAVVVIDDRGPFLDGRVIDLSEAAAERLGMTEAGVVPARLRVVAWGPRQS